MEGAPIIASGVILIRNDKYLPATLIGGIYPFSVRWSFLAVNSNRQFEKTLAISGWMSFCRAGAIGRAAAGIEPQKMIQTALNRVLAGAEIQMCNCLDIDEVKMHSFRTIRYASVLGRAHQLLAGTSPEISHVHADEKRL